MSVRGISSRAYLRTVALCHPWLHWVTSNGQDDDLVAALKEQAIDLKRERKVL